MKDEANLLVREQYLLRSTFFYNRLCTQGYFSLFSQVKRFVKVEGENLDWNRRSAWNVSDSAWDAVSSIGIDPALVFAHPKVLRLNMPFLRYYRSMALLPQKGLATLAQVSNVVALEEGKTDVGKAKPGMVQRLVCVLNEVISTVVSTSHGLSEQRLQGMMFVTAGTTIDGSWRNQIGTEGERLVRMIIQDGLLAAGDVSSFIDRQNNTIEIDSKDARDIIEGIDSAKCINLRNGCSIYFASEPDVTFYNSEGAIVGVVEIKAGLDPAAALERLGAVFKSFENALAEYPEAVTILVASCITKEVDSRLSASMLVRQKFVMAEITADESTKRKFVNRLRVILGLSRPVL